MVPSKLKAEFRHRHAGGLLTRPLKREELSEATDLAVNEITRTWNLTWPSGAINPTKRLHEKILSSLEEALESPRALVLGTFEGNRLAAVSSIMPFNGSREEMSPVKQPSRD